MVFMLPWTRRSRTRSGDPRDCRHDAAVDFWLLFVFLVGPLSYVRFDMIPAVLAGGALLAARTRPWVAGALTGLGAGDQAVARAADPGPAGRPPERASRRRSASCVVGFGLALISLLTGGLIPAVLPAHLAVRPRPADRVGLGHPADAAADGPARRRGWSTSPATRRTRSSAPAWACGRPSATWPPCSGWWPSSVLWVARRSGCPAAVTAVAVALVVLATVTVVIITNKTLSPQYLLWIGGPIAALLLLRDGATPEQRRWIVRIGVAGLVLAALTQLVYPLLYDGYLGFTNTAGLVIATLVTALRNLCLLAFTVVCLLLAWRATSSCPATPTLQLALEDDVDDQHRHHGDHHGREQRAEVHRVAGLRGERRHALRQHVVVQVGVERHRAAGTGSTARGS